MKDLYKYFILIGLLTVLLLQVSSLQAQRFRELTEASGIINAAAYSPDGKWLVTAGSNRSVVFREAKTGEILHQLTGHNRSINSVAFSPDGKLLVSGDQGGELIVWEASSQKLLSRKQAHEGAIDRVAFAQGTGLVASSGTDGQVRIWDLHDNWQQELPTPDNVTYGLCFNKTGELLFTGGTAMTLSMWQVEGSVEKLRLRGHQNSIRAVDLAPDQKMVASGDINGVIRLYDPRSGAFLLKIDAHKGPIRQLRFSPGGEVLASVGYDGKLKFWDKVFGDQLEAFTASDRPLWDFCFSPDGEQLVTVGEDGHARVWDVGYLKLQGSQFASFLPDDSRFAPTTDISKNIPNLGRQDPNRFALIIGNEYYKKTLGTVSDVNFARADALLFKEYAAQTMGIPEQNIVLILDGTAGQMRQGIEQFAKLAKNNGPETELFVFYAGHGVPAPDGLSPCLLPVDLSPGSPDPSLSLNRVMETLDAFPTRRNVLFLDACFNGAGRNDPLVAERGAIIKPKKIAAPANTLVFTAADETEGALPYQQAKHGLFTYFLLKSLNDTRGNLTFGAWRDKVEQQVSLHAILMYGQEQHPASFAGQNIRETWKEWRIGAPALVDCSVFQRER